jgi:cytochrome c-type biogenesis protein
MSDVSNVGALTAFAAGIVSFLSPCVLPLVPGYLSYVAGHSVNGAARPATAHARLPALGLSALFVLGFSTVFVALGASATALGRLLLAYRYEANIVGGAIVALFGLFMTGLVKLPWLERDLRFHTRIPGGRPLGAYGLGLAFGAGWTPCIGPVLGAILTMSAVSSNTGGGIALLSAYALGLGLPFLAAAFFTGGLVHRLKTLRRAGRMLQIGAGAIMIVMGAAIMTGQLSTFSYWLLDAFPVLANIG